MDETELDEQGRPQPPLAGTELATLLGFLDYHRATLQWRCLGLTDEQLNVWLPPSSMTLGGLLKHLAYVENHWLVEVVGGDATVQPWAGVDWSADNDWDWHSATLDTGDQLRTMWAEHVQRSRAVVDGLVREPAALDVTYGRHSVSLRWVLVHLVEEYARHNGHADLIRESIDGQTGE